MCCKHLLPIALLLTPLVAGASPQQWHGKPTTGAATEATAIVEFARATYAYATLHRTVAASLLPEETCADPEETQRRVGQLAEALRSERSAARAGDVFTPAIASIFRRRLADAIGNPRSAVRCSSRNKLPRTSPAWKSTTHFRGLRDRGCRRPSGRP